MKILVIGLGSMGKRRIRLLKEYFDNIEVVGVDFNKERRINVKNEFGIDTYESLNNANSDGSIDGVVICTSPLSHHKIILECLEVNLHVFTEINLISDDYDKIVEIAKKKNKTVFLSSTMLYRNEIEYIDNRVKETKGPVNYMYRVGQYLPDWHPWEDYKNFFVNEKRSNGCREIFAIEMPWIYKTFGRIKDIKVNKCKSSGLDLNYDDTYQVMLVHENGTLGTFIVDVVARKAVTSLEIYGENLHIFWRGTPNSLVNYNISTKLEEKVETYKTIDKNKNYSEKIIENAYFEELKVYLDKISGINNEKYTFEDDKYVLSVIDKIEGV